MSEQAYDEKNTKDYDDNTIKLNDALEKISKNSDLPATQKEVARISGIHRNTVSEREFPAIRLKEIKKQRKEQEQQEQQDIKSKVEELTEERDNIAKEVVYWFSEFTKANKDRDDLELQLRRQIENTDFYKTEFEKQKEKIKTLQDKNEQLKELLRDVK
ncbi:hypothetical protein QX776_15555 [Alteromonadaceae bacterium BrNp21-10]|nr:hypothetical protein [Alteromonadaceae bacterium BrNp21-10]